jgi:hypothetical protein
MKSKNEKTMLAIYIGWAFLHLVFLAIGWSGRSHSYFWPFSDDDNYGRNDISVIYDLSEFLVYVGGPVVVYVIYRLINNEPKNT